MRRASEILKQHEWTGDDNNPPPSGGNPCAIAHRDSRIFFCRRLCRFLRAHLGRHARRHSSSVQVLFLLIMGPSKYGKAPFSSNSPRVRQVQTALFFHDRNTIKLNEKSQELAGPPTTGSRDHEFESELDCPNKKFWRI